MRKNAAVILAALILIALLALFGLALPILIGPEPAPCGVIPTTYGVPPR